jgi:hypothetical protein
MTGPGEVNLIAQATPSITGLRATRRALDAAISRALLVAVVNLRRSRIARSVVLALDNSSPQYSMASYVAFISIILRLEGVR